MTSFTKDIISDCISKSYLQIVQNNYTNVNIVQILDINCDNSLKNCDKCIRTTKEKIKDISMEDVDKICKNLCRCNISDINMNQNITINLETIQNTESSQLFIEELKKNIIVNAEKSGTKLYFDTNRQDTLTKISTDIYKVVSSSQFSTLIEDFLNLQSVTISANNVYNISIDNTIDIVKVVIQNSDILNKNITELSNLIDILTIQYIDSSIAAIIKILSYIVLIIIAIILSITIILFTINFANIF